ncbi:MAG: tRNA (N(6)-L-threonylcarbamoyladenosine(37)-C(2))-methylthiotransferase [Candidatus Marsarchaeota archaeon]|nr:tRNA (N(6)-L-threonylcarbamoyladenosine(37)-C(2))-methylthiotransferase [Candidatus Marsarchaeota archaeon]
MSNMLLDGGASFVDKYDSADVVVLNTCTVKKITEQKILYLIDRLNSKGKKVVVTGCMAGANSNKIKKHMSSASIIAPHNIHKISEVVSNAYLGNRMELLDGNNLEKLSFFKPTRQHIAHVPVSEGCLSSCSFCETKFARGPLKSYDEKLIIRAIKDSVDKGAKEIQLTSQDMGAYGLDKNTNIAILMEKISNIDGDFKVRVGMLNPDHLHKYFDELIEQLKSDRFYKFIHLPIQSGSNKIILDMGRRCSTEQFILYAKELHSKINDITIATDIIVGYPTEGEFEFNETIKFIGELKPELTNISRFGRREHARASKLKEHSPIVINKRSSDLYRIVREIQREKNNSYIGRQIECVITEFGSNSINGRDKSYKQVILNPSDNDKLDHINLGDRLNVIIKRVSANALYASIL